MELQSRKGEVRVLALWGTTRARRDRSNGRLAEKLCVRSRGLFRPPPVPEGPVTRTFRRPRVSAGRPEVGATLPPQEGWMLWKLGSHPEDRLGRRVERVARTLSKGPWAGARAPIPLGRAELQREAGC